MYRGNIMSFIFFADAIIITALLAFGPVSSEEIYNLNTLKTDLDENYSLMFINEGNNATFRCPRTFPDDHVQLFIDGYYEIPMSKRVSFHPDVGFKIVGLIRKDTGLYRCTLKRDHVTRTMRVYDVEVRRIPRPVNVAEIDEYKLRHVIEGQDLSVNCSARISTAHGTAIGWRSYRRDIRRPIRIKTRLYSLTERDYTVIGEELTITNVSSEYEGLYSCCLQIRSSNCMSIVTRSLIIHKPPAYRNEADMEIEHISVQNGTTATLVCPKEFNEHRTQLFIDDNYEVNSSRVVPNDTATVFTIENFVVGDTGIYKCKVEDGKRYQTVKIFDVAVNSGPRELGQPNIDQFRLRHIVEGQTLRVNCTVEEENFKNTNLYWSTSLRTYEDRMSFYQYLEETSDRIVLSSEMTISNISLQDAGIYQCLYGFGVNTPKTASAVLTVYAKSEINES